MGSRLIKALRKLGAKCTVARNARALQENLTKKSVITEEEYKSIVEEETAGVAR